ncbi:hypothetical protein DCO58_04105 [Helicobacter saguini]|uniref:Aspartate/ornithine carbamoyltransferase Asp/Orn-binding domain-containing protein n=2 Tax=Helicobacter saguini TaxID=1548018 RepID=A0A347VMA5_9HELI|nr:hypothetical protein [Helicobacter saguini]MWV66867.1 hypothetical protein [Helicobacter saguini]MWV69216.1 hypothetical protein [Helicobacter saguini]MWV71229.1 hypothetical protein [Helicobacter saguini]TLD93341.1 hypothetical protein LS64_008645 [Helicobacter saguini]
MSMHFGEKYYENSNILDKKLENLDSKNSLDSMESKSQDCKKDSKNLQDSNLDSKKNTESNSQNLIEKKQKACIKGLELMQNKRIAIVGDIKNSRVANSNIELLSRFGVDITLVGPPHFLYKTRLKTAHNLQEIIDNVDIIMALRTQTERHNTQIYGSLKDYANRFCITRELLGNRDIIVLHPGPVHRNIDIDDEMLSDTRSKVLKQVQNGVKIRMSVMEFLCKDFTL